MNNLFGKGKEKILHYFYTLRSKESYFSEILRATKLTPNTTLKHLKSLKEQQIILSSKKTSNTYYKTNPKNKLVYLIFSCFDNNKLNQLPFARKKAILDFLNQITIKPLIVVLFGSTAKETFSKDSDIDLLLVYNKKESQNNKLKEEIESITGVKIQTFIINYEYFKEQLLKKEDKVISHAIKTGYPIVGFDYFYQEVLQ